MERYLVERVRLGFLCCLAFGAAACSGLVAGGMYLIVGPTGVVPGVAVVGLVVWAISKIIGSRIDHVERDKRWKPLQG